MIRLFQSQSEQVHHQELVGHDDHDHGDGDVIGSVRGGCDDLRGVYGGCHEWMNAFLQ